MAKNMHTEYIKRIQQLDTRNASLEKKLDECRAEVATLNQQKTEKKTEPLTRSSIEAYLGVAIAVVLAVFPVTWWVRILLFIILCSVCVDSCWHSPATLKHMSKPLRIVTCITIGLVLSWIGLSNVKKAWQTENLPPHGITYLKTWGAAGEVKIIRRPPPSRAEFVGTTSAGRIWVDGSLLKDYSDRYRLWAVCFHWDGSQDPLDTRNISHTELFDINGGDILMVIPWNQQYFNELLDGSTTTQYVLILVPKKVNRSDFNTIREALNTGGYTLEWHAGPP